jgi:tetratricopeptide (TPR) repeat protein
LLLAIGEVAEAKDIARDLLTSNPGFGPGFELLALVQRAEGDIAGELRTLDRWSVAYPQLLDPHQMRGMALLQAGAHDAALASARATARRLDAPQLIAQVKAQSAALRGDKDAAAEVLEHLAEHGDPILKAHLERVAGRPAEAVRILRKAMPAWFQDPVTSPNLDNEYGSVESAFALLAAGDPAQARRALEFALPSLQKRAPGAGFGGGRAWAETMAMALLGRLDEACRAMEQAADTGFYHAYEWLRAEPALAPLREKACFDPLYGRVQANAARQVAQARKAGLL